MIAGAVAAQIVKEEMEDERRFAERHTAANHGWFGKLRLRARRDQQLERAPHGGQARPPRRPLEAG